MNDCNHYTIEPFFLPFGQESIFCVFLAPVTAKLRAAVLYMPPFAEEMHKSRRMAALQARQFAQAGYAVLQIDLLGCGDSTGDFEDAKWETWQACAQAAHNWLREKTQTPIVLWGLRLGATLAAELSTQLPRIAGLILWQPVANGENFLNQFLRIKIASEMFAERKIGVKDLRGKLLAGEAVEVGGYMLAPPLTAGVDKLRLAQLTIAVPVCWLDVSATPSTQPLPASLKVIDTWIESGTTVFTRTIEGDSFWATQEIIECPNLLVETNEALERLGL